MHIDPHRRDVYLDEKPDDDLLGLPDSWARLWAERFNKVVTGDTKWVDGMLLTLAEHGVYRDLDFKLARIAQQRDKDDGGEREEGLSAGAKLKMLFDLFTKAAKREYRMEREPYYWSPVQFVSAFRGCHPYMSITSDSGECAGEAPRAARIETDHADKAET